MTKFVIGLVSESWVSDTMVMNIPLVVENPEVDELKVAEFDSVEEARDWARNNEGIFDCDMFDWEVFEKRW